MRASKKNVIGLSLAIAATIVFCFCGEHATPALKQNKNSDSLAYLGHQDSAKYVGMNTCKLCHQNIYNSFIKTGMGKSFDLATKSKSSGNFTSAGLVDKIANLSYQAYWDHDSMFIKEFRVDKNDTIHQRIEQVNYIVGSGQHTNSHLKITNGYLSQMPMTFYTQKKRWDLPPGFENGVNTRFSRKIGLECMSCHNAFPEYVLGSENKYSSIGKGIDCERCHGPGSAHVAQRQTGSKIDTSKYIDYSIVNPAKLSIDAQFDICQRCHLQGNTVLKEGKSFFDFKPGQKLSDYMSVFLPKYKNADKEFIMASHADRLKQSACFIKSYEKVKAKNALKPYKDAMTCVTCHNPHISVRETNKNTFNEACINCHKDIAVEAGDKKNLLKSGCGLFSSKMSNCTSCHMPASGSTDIPHVSVHDHFIRKPITKNEKEKIKTFIGLFSINEKKPSALTRAKAYINQYDKFDPNPCFLDSAANLLKGIKDLKSVIHTLIHLYFIKQDYKQIISSTNQLGIENCYDQVFVRQSFDNSDAWAAYRIAEAFYFTGDVTMALRWLKKSITLAPFNLDFRNKYGSVLVASNQVEEAVSQFNFIISQNPKYLQAYTNLGYIRLRQGQPKEAFKLYMIAEKLDPDNETILLNLSGYFMEMNDKLNAKKYLNLLVKRYPDNQKARLALKQLSS